MVFGNKDVDVKVVINYDRIDNYDDDNFKHIEIIKNIIGVLET